MTTWLVKWDYFLLISFTLSIRLRESHFRKYNPTRNPLQIVVGFHTIKIIFYKSNFVILWPWKILKLRKIRIGSIIFHRINIFHIINYFNEYNLLQQNECIPITPSKPAFNFWLPRLHGGVYMFLMGIIFIVVLTTYMALAKNICSIPWVFGSQKYNIGYLVQTFILCHPSCSGAIFFLLPLGRYAWRLDCVWVYFGARGIRKNLCIWWCIWRYFDDVTIYWIGLFKKYFYAHFNINQKNLSCVKRICLKSLWLLPVIILCSVTYAPQ